MKSLSIACFTILIWLVAPMIDSTVQAQALPKKITMDLDRLKEIAFARCQSNYQAPVVPAVPALDPPADGHPHSTGMVYQEELAVRTTNLLDQNLFYFSPRPRAAVNSLPMDVYVSHDQSGNYVLKTWDDANPDYSNPFIQPVIDKAALPDAGKVLTELIIGHRAPDGGWPQLFDIRSSAYVRFAGFPPQVTGASLRLGAHKIFSLGAPGQDNAEDFPIIRSVFVSTKNDNTAHAYILLESKLFCGALSMDMSPTGTNAEIIVDQHFYTRENFQWKSDPHTGLVAYSSMFWKSIQQQSGSRTDSAHDSDTMTVQFADGKEKRVKLFLPKTGLKVMDLTSGSKNSHATSWILSNEDRDPAHYADFKPALGDTNYDLRASYKVEILASNVKTGVTLYQQATDGEYGDNIVALSTIRQDIAKSTSPAQSVHFKYRTVAFYPEAPVKNAGGDDECEFIRKKLLALPPSGGTVKIPAGTFNCESKIVIKSNHVKLRGAGRHQTTLRLADHWAAPVLVIGDDRVVQDQNGNWVTATRVTDIEVSDLTIDGNMQNQDVHNECGDGPCDGDVANIRNNAITIRGASYVTVQRVTTHSAISGGLVTEKYCNHLHVKDFTSYGNYFDGFAGYQTEQSVFENINLSRNRGAGISIDIDFNNNIFRNGLLASNGDVGIFARHIHGVMFENLKITQSGNHGAFLASAEGPNSCANNNEFRSVLFEGSKGWGIFIADACHGNTTTGTTTFSKNKSGCYFVNPATTLSVAPTVRCN